MPLPLNILEDPDFLIKYAFLIIFIGLFIFLALLGFIRATIMIIKPDFILNQKKIQDDWSSRTSVTSMLLPVLAFFIFLFNAVGWMVYGIVTIFEFIAFIFKSLWRIITWIVLWIWNEVIHPVIFFIVKLVWHYLIIWSWRFFKLAITRIPEAFSVSTFRNGFISVLGISFIVFFLLYLTSILEQEWIIIAMTLPFLLSIVFFAGYTLYNDSKRNFSEYWSLLSTSRHAVMILIAILSTAVILLLHIFAGTAIQLPVLGISFPIVQVLLIILVIAILSSLIANTILPAYLVSKGGEFETKDFLKNTAIRLPRYIGAVPFVLFGGGITSLATLIIGGFLWWSTNEIKQGFSENAMNKMQNELYNYNADFYAFADTVSQVNRAKEYPIKKLRRIAVLESRIYTLDFFSENWYEVMFNLSSGVRSVKTQKNIIISLERKYKDDYERITKEISDLDAKLCEIKAAFNSEPENSLHSKNIEITQSSIRSFRHQLNKLESAFILNVRLTEATIRSYRATNFMWIVGSFFAMLGLVLLTAIVLTPFWVYRTKTYFDLFDYHHEGKSYLEEQIEYYKERNVNQPLLGFFVVVIVIVLALIVL
jgi:hypothetical protein